MDIEQIVVFRPEEIVELVATILHKMDEDCNPLPTPSLLRLVAFELMASPEILKYNTVLNTTAGVYTRQDIALECPQPGFVVFRAPLLSLVTMLLDHRMDQWTAANTTCTILTWFLQDKCCWYNANQKKACACEAVETQVSVETSDDNTVTDLQTHRSSMFCRKHWSPVLRQAKEEERSTMYPSSETNLDEWLEEME